MQLENFLRYELLSCFVFLVVKRWKVGAVTFPVSDTLPTPHTQVLVSCALWALRKFVFSAFQVTPIPKGFHHPRLCLEVGIALEKNEGILLRLIFSHLRWDYPKLDLSLKNKSVMMCAGQQRGGRLSTAVLLAELE